MVQRDPEWTQLESFSGGDLAFVRELFADEHVPYREEPQLPMLGIARSILLVAAPEHARAVALLAEAQAEAAEAVQREAAEPAADEAQPSQALPRETAAPTSEAPPSEPALDADRAVRFIAGGLLAFMLVITIIFVIGERYGTHRPTPGRDGKVCFGPRQIKCL
jgi:hypothetical protein